MPLTIPKTRTLATCILLFLIVFGFWQAYYLIIISFSPTALQQYILYIVIYGLCLTTYALFVKLGKSSFKNYGFKTPVKTKKCILLSVSSILFYLLIILMPGFTGGFGYPSLYHSLFYYTFNISRAFLISLTTEAIFRGYIFKNLTKNHGFFTSLYASSLLFSLGREELSILSLLTMNADRFITFVFTDILPTFIAGLFLGYMFYKMNWSLLGNIIFRTGILLYFFFPPITTSPPWWMGLTLEATAYACLIIIVDSAIKEPKYRRRKYGLES